MHWKLKCLAFHLLSLPGGNLAYRFAQRNITKTYFTRLTPERLRLYSLHVEHYRRSPGVALEFGSGGELLAPLLLSAAGAPEILTYDVTSLANPARVNNIIRQLRQMQPGNWPEIESLADLWTRYRIRYLAPADVRATDLPDKSIDFVWSTSTLEHIPTDQIRAILAECKRICRGQMSFVIDYHDHYPGVSPCHFYRYGARQWRWLNPAWHYQNRLRHGDFARLFSECGLATRDDFRAELATGAQLGPLAADFRHYSPEDLMTMQGHFVLSAA